MQDNYMRDLLKDLGSNRTPSNSIMLTSGKDEGAIDVTRKDTINATATAGEKITMYHPSGSTIQVFPNEVQLFISNGYSTTPSAGVPQQPVVVAPQQPAVVNPQEPQVVAPQQPGGIVTTPTPVVGPEMVPTGEIGRPGDTLTPSLGVTAPPGTSGPQAITVPMDSEEDLALQNDPNYNETVNDDGTVTYTPNSEIAIPDEDAPVGSPEQQAAVNSPGNFEAPTDNPVGINGNPRLIFDEEKGWIKNPAYTPQEMIASDDSLETADAVEEAAIQEFESDSNINNTDDASTNLTTVADLTEDGEGVTAVEQTDDAFTEIELDTSTTPEEKKTLAGGLLDGLKGLFKDGELAKAAMLYFGSRIAGFDSTDSAKFAYGATDLIW